jgi:hypothetical protein
MPAFLENYSPNQLVAVFATAGGAVCLLVMILAITWYHLRALADATALQRERLNVESGLKRELIQRGLPPHELEQTIKLLRLDEPPPPPPSQQRPGVDYVAEFVKMAVQLPKLPPEGLEEIIALVRAADEPHQRNAVTVVAGFVLQEIEGPVALAALRSLLRPAEKPRVDGLPLELSSHITR